MIGYEDLTWIGNELRPRPAHRGDYRARRKQFKRGERDSEKPQDSRFRPGRLYVVRTFRTLGLAI
jgi:hypothetical protein